MGIKKVFLFISIYFNFISLFSQVESDSLMNSGKVYHLGEVVISGSIDREKITASEIQKYNAPDVASALNVLPSVIFNNVGARNEGTLFIRGFDLRAIPVFMDGIPVYVPYDGNLDLSRFTTFDLSGIDISKGFSSMVYGPNTLGGAINLISSQPTKKLEIGVKAGVISNNGYTTALNAGSRRGKFFYQGSVSILENKFMPLSKDFDTLKLETDYKRDNSYRKDYKANLKIGFMPNSTDVYSLNYIYQHGEKGNPVYLGSDPSIRLRYWQWPYWDKESLYFISKTAIGEKSQVKTNLFFDKFKNKIKSFDDNTYTSQTKGYAFTSVYDDYSLGGGIDFLTEKFSRNALKFAVQFKNDNHSEHNIGEPVRHTSDNTFSVAVEDVYKPFNKLTVVPGLSYNLRKSLEAEDYDSKNVIISDFPENKSTAANAQAGFYYDLSPDITMNFNAAHKTRFATMKDRYSYKLGTAIPNPDLKAESAENFELAATIRLFKKLSIRPELYYTKLNNTIQLVSNVQDDLSQMQNTGRSEFRGFDFTLNLYPVENLLYYFTYSYIDQRNLSQPEILFIDVPENKFFSSIEYKFRTRAEWMLSGEYNSRRNNSSDGSRISPGYFVMNSQFVFNFGKYFKTEMGVKNIFDKNYTINEGYPEAGRIFHISAFFTFRI